MSRTIKQQFPKPSRAPLSVRREQTKRRERQYWRRVAQLMTTQGAEI